MIVYGCAIAIEWSRVEEEVEEKEQNEEERCCTELILQINVSSPDDAMNFDELVAGAIKRESN